jgi:hypothetical protein
MRRSWPGDGDIGGDAGRSRSRSHNGLKARDAENAPRLRQDFACQIANATKFIALDSIEPFEFLLYFGKPEGDLKNFALRDLGTYAPTKPRRLPAARGARSGKQPLAGSGRVEEGSGVLEHRLPIFGRKWLQPALQPPLLASGWPRRPAFPSAWVVGMRQLVGRSVYRAACRFGSRSFATNPCRLCPYRPGLALALAEVERGNTCGVF